MTRPYLDILLQGKKGFQTIIGYCLVVLSLGLYTLEELYCVTQEKSFSGFFSSKKCSQLAIQATVPEMG